MPEGCCSLQCGAKTVAWIQVVGNAIVALVFFLAIIMLPKVAEEQKYTDRINSRIEEIETEKGTEFSADEKQMMEHKVMDSAYTIAFVILIIFLLFHLFIVAVATILLMGIYQNKPKYIMIWLWIKGVLTVLVAGTIFLELLSMLLATDPGSITKQITWLVLDVVQIWVVYAYYQEKKEEILPTY